MSKQAQPLWDITSVFPWCTEGNHELGCQSPNVKTQDKDSLEMEYNHYTMNFMGKNDSTW